MSSNLPPVDEDSGLSGKRNLNASTASLLDASRSVHLHNTMIPSQLDTKQEIILRSAAKREAYDILRRPRTSISAIHEDSEFRIKDPTFDNSYTMSQMSTPKGSRPSSFVSAIDVSGNVQSNKLRKSVDISVRKSTDFTKKSVDFSGPDGSIRLPSIRGSISVNNSGSLVTNSTVNTSSSKKNHMVRASFAF